MIPRSPWSAYTYIDKLESHEGHEGSDTDGSVTEGAHIDFDVDATVEANGSGTDHADLNLDEPKADHVSVGSDAHEDPMPAHVSPNPQPPPMQTRTLRSRESIKPPDIYSPSKWQSAQSHTDWKAQQPAQVISNYNSTKEHIANYASYNIENPHFKDVKDYRRPGHRLSPDQIHALAVAVTDASDPVSMSQAFASDEGEKWRKAADEEYQSLIKSQTWILTKLPPGCQAITNKWIFKRKYASDGQVSRYKARLIVRGFSQRYGQDYDETFAPIAKFPTLRMLLALAAHSDLILQQMDVKATYLNNEITKDIFMVQPKGYITKGAEDLVCKLTKGLYGLTQGGRQWNQKLDKTLKKLGFRKSDSNASLYIMKGKELI